MITTVLSFTSFLIGVVGLLVGYLQYRDKVRVESVMRMQLTMVINRIRAMVSYRKDLETMLADVKPPDVLQWTWTQYKGLSDLYVAVVTYYLATQKLFTFNHLERLVQAGTIQTRWEERIWRDLLSLRAENKNCRVHEFFTEDDDTKTSKW